MRARHDRRAKDLVEILLANDPRLVMQTEAEISTETQRADVLITPNNSIEPLEPSLGMLGRMLRQMAILELFSCAPSTMQTLMCLRKHLTLRCRAPRLAMPPTRQARLWLVCSGDPKRVREQWRMKPARSWGRGVYRGPPGSRMWLVVLPQLARNRSTLTLRALGRARVLEEAIEDMLELAPDDVLFPAVDDIVSVVSVSLDDPSSLSSNTMNRLLQKYQQRAKSLVDQGVSQGIERGIEQGARMAIVDLCELLGIELDESKKARMDALDRSGLDALRLHLKTQRAWPE